MDPEKQRAIASKGGKAAHAKGSAHQFTSDEAREAGRKGGRASHQKAAARESFPNEARETALPPGMPEPEHEQEMENQFAHAGATEGNL